MSKLAGTLLLSFVVGCGLAGACDEAEVPGYALPTESFTFIVEGEVLTQPNNLRPYSLAGSDLSFLDALGAVRLELDEHGWATAEPTNDQIFVARRGESCLHYYNFNEGLASILKRDIITNDLQDGQTLQYETILLVVFIEDCVF
jgi:hypothetical protein